MIPDSTPRQPWRGVPPLWWFLSLVAMFILNRNWPLITWLHTPWTYVGYLVIVLGGVIGILSIRRFRTAGTTIDPIALGATVLVSEGLYQYTRNPMYAGLVLVLLGAALCMGSLTPFFVIPVFMAIIQTLFIRHEEAHLLGVFGDEYAAYQRRVRRWI